MFMGMGIMLGLGLSRTNTNFPVSVLGSDLKVEWTGENSTYTNGTCTDDISFDVIGQDTVGFRPTQTLTNKSYKVFSFDGTDDLLRSDFSTNDTIAALAALPNIGNTTLVTVSGVPSTYASGTWPSTILNTGKWNFSFSPTNVQSDDAAYGRYNGLLISGPGGGQGFFLLGDHAGNRWVYVTDQTGAVVLSQSITWTVGDVINISVDIPLTTLIISGATGGNGSFSFIPLNPLFDSSGTLYVGELGDTSGVLTGTITNINSAVPGQRLFYCIFKLSSVSGTNYIIATLGNNSIYINGTTGILYITKSDGGYAEFGSNSRVDNNNWYRLIVLCDENSTTTYMYLNGILQTSTGAWAWGQPANWGAFGISFGQTLKGYLGRLGFAYTQSSFTSKISNLDRALNSLLV